MGEGFGFSSYIDANKDVLVIKLLQHTDYSLRMPLYFNQKLNNGGLDYPSYEEIKDGHFRIIKQRYESNKMFYIFVYENGNDLYITIKKKCSINKLKDYLINYSKNESLNYQKHLEYWSNYFNQSHIETPDKEINDTYIKGEYFFACNSRKKYPMTLHGVWTANNDRLPMWKADLHQDINVQMSYDTYYKLNHFKEGKVIIDFYKRLLPQFRKNAKEFLGSEGIWIPGVMSQNGVPLGGWPQYAMNPACSIWVLKIFENYYEYCDSSESFLNEMFFFFEETEKCIRSILVKDDDGCYSLPFHSSPEYFENDKKSIFTSSTNFELTMLRYLYERLCCYGKMLGVNTTSYKEILDNLSKYYRDDDGCLMISKTQPYDKSHRHFSHMLMYKNMEMVDPTIDTNLIEKDINNLLKYGHSEWVGFSPVELSGLYSYIFNGEGAYNELKTFIKYFIHDNGFHMNSDYKRLGYNEYGPYVLTLEANIGFNKSLADMMLYSNFGNIVIFPAIPAHFKEKGCGFKDLIAKGGIKISAEIKNSEIQKIYIKNSNRVS
ncbi:MAG: hypothetical protein HUJ61_07675, partial [Bacilli bacterium]|nr:hypothetical protein [Bacilli bacterium]